MQSGSDKAAYLLKALILPVVAVVLFVGWKLFPIFISSLQFKKDLASQVRILGRDERFTGELHDVIYRSAQDKGLPIRPEDIQVEYAPSGTRVSADYTVIADLGFGHFFLHFHPEYPEPKEFFPPVQRGFLGAIVFLLGIYLFFQGFGVFREYKVIADTPLTPIRSIAMGRVQISGRAVGEKTLRSPVSNQTCFLYRVEIERFFAGNNGIGRWNPFLTDMGSVEFYLEDETGKVLIDPRSAELDLEQTYQCELSSQEVVPPDAPWRQEVTAFPPGSPTPDSELRRYVQRVAEGVNTAAFQGADLASSLEAGKIQHERQRRTGGSVALLRGLLPLVKPDQIESGASPGDYRLTEYCVVPESEYDITGSCAMNPLAGNGLDRQVITRGQNDTTFLISSQAKKGLEEDLHIRAWWHIVGGGLLAVGGAGILLEALGLIV